MGMQTNNLKITGISLKSHESFDKIRVIRYPLKDTLTEFHFREGDKWFYITTISKEEKQRLIDFLSEDLK